MDFVRCGRGDPFMVRHGSWVDLKGGGCGAFGFGGNADFNQIGAR